MYITRQVLNTLVRDAQLKGQVSDELALAFQQIASGALDRWKFAGLDVEDAVQGAVLLLLSKVSKLDTTRNCFSFCTTSVLNYYRQEYRNNKKRTEKHDRFKKHLGG